MEWPLIDQQQNHGQHTTQPEAISGIVLILKFAGIAHPLHGLAQGTGLDFLWAGTERPFEMLKQYYCSPVHLCLAILWW